jgi:hypothetical protein
MQNSARSHGRPKNRWEDNINLYLPTVTSSNIRHFFCKFLAGPQGTLKELSISLLYTECQDDITYLCPVQVMYIATLTFMSV